MGVDSGFYQDVYHGTRLDLSSSITAQQIDISAELCRFVLSQNVRFGVGITLCCGVFKLHVSHNGSDHPPFDMITLTQECYSHSTLQDSIPERDKNRGHRSTARTALFSLLDGQDLGRCAGNRYMNGR